MQAQQFTEELNKLIVKREDHINAVEEEKDRLRDQRHRNEELRAVLKQHEDGLDKCCLDANNLILKLQQKKETYKCNDKSRA